MSDHQHDIEKYLKGELTPAERHALEKKALSDPFLADALEGAEKIDATIFSKDVDELNKNIAGQKSKVFWMWPMRIAAGVAILIASTYLVWQAFESQQEIKQLAFEQKETVSPQPTIADSSTTEDLSSEPVEKPTVGPAVKETEIDSRSTYPSQADAKPTEPIVVESKPEKAIVSAEEAGESIQVPKVKADDNVFEAKSAEEEEVLKNKTEEVQRAKKLSLAKDDQKKEMAAAASQMDRASGASSVGQRIIRGRVTSAEDGSVLPGVNVVIKGSTIGTVTDAGGNYQVEVGQTNPTLVYSFIGLNSTEVNAGDRNQVDVSMSLDATQLSEVVVTAFGVGSGEPSAPTVDLAHPVNGYRSFKQYLQQNIHYPEEAKLKKIEGRVTVEFTVESNGALTNFIVIRGIGYGCDNELIRLIKEGPVWIPTKKDGAPFPDKAKVRLKFELPK